MALMRFLVIGFVAAVLVACGDDDSSFATRPSGDSSSSVTPQNVTLSEVEGSNDSETSVSSSSTKPSSSSVESSSSDGYVEPSTVVKGTMTDERDGQTYKTVTIGTQTWMAENLNYAYTGVPYKFVDNESKEYTSDSTSWCYNNDPSNCTKYGRLYTWSAAMDSVGMWSTNGKGCGIGGDGVEADCSLTYPVRGICPEGWHLPTQDEWENLVSAVGDSAAMRLMSASGWSDGGNGTDDYGFSAFPAGLREVSGVYYDEGNYAMFWSSTETINDYGDSECILEYDYDICKESANIMLLNYSNLHHYWGVSYGVKATANSVRCVKDN
ncbi:fibrobacter succinogenes major paralogous domain-containing protein [Fibrobacter sp. UBA4309]|uniref:fibrobacter succinogenes major paralogous domain-containing protein n=1 Tax=Fibrobacter sp. UBA4309 TaxID=1946537 RepID=UPI0025C5E19E|nr:fibrobacter succinogenes major paralogous domain-containing protein [Fibrobacter sp. UBA4309]